MNRKKKGLSRLLDVLSILQIKERERERESDDDDDDSDFDGFDDSDVHFVVDFFFGGETTTTTTTFSSSRFGKNNFFRIRWCFFVERLQSSSSSSSSMSSRFSLLFSWGGRTRCFVVVVYVVGVVRLWNDEKMGKGGALGGGAPRRRRTL